jgi:hypothetical protein
LVPQPDVNLGPQFLNLAAFEVKDPVAVVRAAQGSVIGTGMYLVDRTNGVEVDQLLLQLGH